MRVLLLQRLGACADEYGISIFRDSRARWFDLPLEIYIYISSGYLARARALWVFRAVNIFYRGRLFLTYNTHISRCRSGEYIVFFLSLFFFFFALRVRVVRFL